MTSIPLGGPVRNQIVPWKVLGEGDSEVTYFDELKRYRDIRHRERERRRYCQYAEIIRKESEKRSKNRSHGRG